MNIRKARKDHICDLCLKEIKKGSRYIRVDAKDEEFIHTRKEHLNCELHNDKITAQIAK